MPKRPSRSEIFSALWLLQNCGPFEEVAFHLRTHLGKFSVLYEKTLELKKLTDEDTNIFSYLYQLIKIVYTTATLSGMFRDILRNAWRHSPEFLMKFLEYNLPPIFWVPRILFPVPVFKYTQAYVPSYKKQKKIQKIVS